MDKFDPYRERLVMETETRWDEACAVADPAARERVSLALHEDPRSACNLEYVRTHTGFCRRVIVMPQDLERLGIQQQASSL
ncbi:hypothetical protein [Aeoliella sp. SH292]|uniref:hypothetical protein n=1 Tax=Aeoliella sp. SH292 TaxID=3454464 RepID=UPI003F9C3D34